MSLSDEQKRARKAEQQRQRRKKQREIKNETAWLDIRPKHIAAAIAQGVGNIEPMPKDQLEPWERAPAHLQNRQSEGGGFDDDAVIHQARVRGAGRGQQRASDAQEAHSELRVRYPELVGKQGAAKEVARLERERLEGLETDDERIPSLRTLQKIFKATRI